MVTAVTSVELDILITSLLPNVTCVFNVENSKDTGGRL